MAELNVTVMVDNTAPVRTPDGGWKIDVRATAQRSRGNPTAGQLIDFFRDDIKFHEAQTEEDGSTALREIAVPAGTLNVKIGAQPAKDASRRHSKVVRWEGAAPKPASVKLFTMPIKSRGRYDASAETYENEYGGDGQDVALVVILVLDGNENPVAGEPVFTMDKEDPRMVYQLDTPTDRHGFARCEIPMAGNKQKRDIFVLVRGIQEKISLYPLSQQL